jgi:CheY-like chemotaxis protein
MIPTSEALKDLKVLYVEDEDIARLSIATFLKRQVGEIMTAENGNVGLQNYIEHRPAVVITDLEMPVMNGLEMIRRIRELDDGIPIIITTAYDDEAHACPQANRVILKPIRFMDLVQALEECVAAKEG